MSGAEKPASAVNALEGEERCRKTNDLQISRQGLCRDDHCFLLRGSFHVGHSLAHRMALYTTYFSSKIQILEVFPNLLRTKLAMVDGSLWDLICHHLVSEMRLTII